MSPFVNTNFRNIGLIGRPDKNSVVETLSIIFHHLLDRGLNPIFEQQTHALVDFPDAQCVSRHMLGETCDLVIVVGGDGSLLHAARVLVKHHTPVVGVNRGRLGFLTDISPADVVLKLDQILSGDYISDQRFLLEMSVRREQKVIHNAIALNDIVFHSGKSVHMIDFAMEIDGHFVYRQHSDGLIVSTPTGSTAYALSGGGPIVYPSMDAMILVPMHPHNLSSRPIVVSGSSEIKINTMHSNVLPMISADGQTSISLAAKDEVYIKKHPYKLHLLHPPGYDFYAACRTKLGWYQDNDTTEKPE